MTEMALRSRMAVLVVVALLSVYPVSVWTGGAGTLGQREVLVGRAPFLGALRRHHPLPRSPPGGGA